MNQSDVYEYLEKKDTLFKNRELFICKNDKEAQKTADTAILLDYKAFILPDLRLSRGDDLRSFQVEIYELIEALHAYYSTKKKRLLIAPVRTLLLALPKEEFFKTIEIEFASSLNLKELKDTLYNWSYHFVDIVTQKGEVSFRGDIIDIFPLGSIKAYRISLFDEDVESIREFSLDTQKSSKDELESIKIIPALLALNAKEHESLKERVIKSSIDVFVKDIDSLGLWYLNEFGDNYLKTFNPLFLSNMSEELDEIYSLDTPLIDRADFNLPVIQKAKKFRELQVINPNAIIKSNAQKKITLIAKNESIIRGSQLHSFENMEFVYKDIIVNLISNEKVFISLNKPIKRKKVKKASMILDELKLGDYVVHENHGVGLFKGVEKRVVLGATREFVVILYQNEDTLLIPVENLNVIDRYVADSGGLPVLDKMGKASFKRLRGKVKEKLFAIASEIINISAQRHLKKGIVFKRDLVEHQIFMSQAGFVHTQDQEEAINAMLDDMASGKMMDRLLSADVGFGKTEVAMNGMFIAFQNGYQSMMVAPTTLLSSQHFKSMKERFEKYDIKIGKLDRFTTGKEKKALLEALENGKVDMVVGTHALLKAKFKNLAFIIIDEEHKFGVKQKEALKEIAVNVHLLSMSATPIPRSLNMALSSVKTFSEILTPPIERQGVRTFVKSYDEKIIKEAITREMRRAGQIFYVFNSIAQIEEKRKVLLELLPKLRISVLHSKISAVQTEKDMALFEAGEYDVMLSTSIVESGIHMPHANTMIVDGADNFGIADLHQLRGRVGRGGKEGYCYFMVEDKERISENAKKRLLALESHSALGSGAVLAFHDLEIRGGGNIIGEAQSGHIKQIGYSLYLRMLEDAIKELSGKVEEQEHHVDIKLTIDAYLNEELIEEDRLRLELYRRLSQCESTGEVYEIETEIADRFGKLDVISRQFIDVMVMKVLAREQKITKVANAGEKVFIEFLEDGKERVMLKAYSKDDDDLIACAMEYLKGRNG
ncbi:Transcription-repair coupling factor [hydrothermal vent metagenome]|uniref:Transcription-repair coupling factor n=1 Tax=hydrothermal vent metagenome TaxID=652676 RepID=A0A1W1CEU2_9ZZZZ